MAYIDRVLQPGERVIRVASLHWVVYLPGLLLLVLAAALAAAGGVVAQAAVALWVVAGLLGVAGVLLVLRAWLEVQVTEMAVTDRRVVYKAGLISRHTAEMNMDKVESVIVDQSIWGRMLDYGTVRVRGTGDSLEDLRGVASPLAVRSAITAR